MVSLAEYEQPFDEVEAAAATLINEVAELWHGSANDPAGVLSLPGPDAQPADRVAFILRVRPRLDRIEAIKASLLLMRARLRQMRHSANEAAQEKWNQFNHDQRQTSARRGVEFEGPRERYADADLASLAEQRAVRRIDRVLILVDAAYDYTETARRALDGTRSEQNSFYRGLTLEAGIER